MKKYILIVSMLAPSLIGMESDSAEESLDQEIENQPNFNIMPYTQQALAPVHAIISWKSQSELLLKLKHQEYGELIAIYNTRTKSLTLKKKGFNPIVLNDYNINILVTKTPAYPRKLYDGEAHAESAHALYRFFATTGRPEKKRKRL